MSLVQQVRAIKPAIRSSIDSQDRAEACGDSIPVLSDEKADRKSTRLNSSHSQISYAVFCLTKHASRASETEHLIKPLNQPTIQIEIADLPTVCDNHHGQEQRHQSENAINPPEPLVTPLMDD